MPVRPWLSRLVLVLAFTLPALAGNHRWTLHGPFGGYIGGFTYDPAESSIVYAAGPGGLFRSSDGGQHWSAAPELMGRGIGGVAVAQTDPNIVYAASVFGLYKSTDRGLTWHQVHPFASFAVAVSRTDANVVYSSSTGGPIRSNDGGVTFGNAGGGLPQSVGARMFAIDPLNADVVYITTFGGVGVYRSNDGGAQWTAINAGVTTTPAYSITVHPTTPNLIYLGTSGAMYRSVNGGTTWSTLAIQLPAITAATYGFAISPVAPSTIYAATERGVAKSTNLGSTWSLQPQSPSALAIAVNPNNPQEVLTAMSFKIHRSVNGAASFTLSNDGLTAFYTDTIIVDPKNPARVYASGPAGFARSNDRGKTWTLLSNIRITNGIVDPIDSSILYGLSDGTLRRSTDGGVTWTAFGGTAPAGILHDLDLDPRNPGTIYVVSSGSIYRKVGTGPWQTHGPGLPNGQAEFLTVDPTTSTLYTGGTAGLFKSTDNGTTWTSILANDTYLGLTVDPFDANHLFTWTFFHSVFESRDGGVTWTLNRAVAGLIAFDPSTQGVVYTREGNIARSVNGGATFGVLSAADGLVNADSFAVAPDGNTVYTGGTASGVWTYELGRRRAAAH